MNMDDFLKLQEDAVAQQILDRLVACEQQLASQEKQIKNLTGMLNAQSQRLAECEKVCKAPHVVKIASKCRFEPLFPTKEE